MATNANKQNNEGEVATLGPSFGSYLAAAKKFWYWFLISVLFFVGVAILYILRQQPAYERKTEILIKDQDSGGGVGDIAGAFSSLGLVSSNTSVYNEMISLKSPAVMEEVVKALKLDMNYFIRSGIRWNAVYGSNQPYIVALPDLDEQQGGGFEMEVGEDGKIRFHKFYKDTEDGVEKYDDEYTAGPGDIVVRTPLGKLYLSPNPSFKGDRKALAGRMKVSRVGTQFTVEKYSDKLKGFLADDDADVIELQIKDVSVQRAVDILNEVVKVYNSRWAEDKNKLAIATSKFIEDRLVLLEQELGSVDNDIADYKTENMLPDLPATAMAVLEESKELTSGMLEVTNRLAMANYIKQYLADPAHKYSIIPVNAGTGSEALEKLIGEYNQLLMSRNNLVANSSADNPIVADYDMRISGMRESVERTLRGDMASLESVIRNMKNEQGRAEGKIRQAPTQAKMLRSKERQQTVKESLYLYLLQKKEENELTQTFNSDNTRIITPPTGSLLPVSPKKALILFIAIVLGLGIPAAFVYLTVVSDTKVHSRSDFDNFPVPFAGEIPQVGKRRKPRKLKKGEVESAPMAVVREGNRNIINEAFRVARSNIDFMIGKEGDCSVIMMTSFNPGSGKSFISYNLGVSFALKGKRVLIIDCDMRHGSLSMYVGSPSKGLSGYLGGHSSDWKALVRPVADVTGVDILPAGKLPSNPAELLDGERFGKLIHEVRSEYDYVLIDCPPVDIVVDTQIVERHCDRTIFVVRAGVLDKSMLTELRSFYEEKRYRHISVMLNGTEGSNSRFSTYGSYHYHED